MTLLPPEFTEKAVQSESTGKSHDSAGIPRELLTLANDPIWGFFEILSGTDHRKRPGKGKNGSTQSCNKPVTLFTLEEAQAELVGKDRVLSVSLKLASEKLGRVFSIKDLDAYKEGFDQDLLKYYKQEETFIDKSPSGQGYHVWYSYNITPTHGPKQTGVDNVAGFITLSGNVIKNLPIDHMKTNGTKLLAEAQILQDPTHFVIGSDFVIGRK